MFEADEGSGAIVTERLRLRPPRREDAEAIYRAYSGDAEVTRYLAWPMHQSVGEVEQFIRFSDEEWRRWSSGPYLLETRTGGELLGATGLAFETAYRASTGFVLAREAWGQGYAGEALAAMVAQARRMGIQRLYALCHSEHSASARVLEKAGFLFEGILHRYQVFPNLPGEEAVDVDCYAMPFEVDTK